MTVCLCGVLSRQASVVRLLTVFRFFPRKITSAVDGSNVARRVLDGVKYVSQTVSFV